MMNHPSPEWSNDSKSKAADPDVDPSVSSPLVYGEDSRPGGKMSTEAVSHGPSEFGDDAPPRESDGAAQALASAMCATDVSDADVKRGKAQLKAQVLYGAENGESLLSDLANQAALLGSVRSPIDLIADIDAVSTQAVQQALRKFTDSKNKSLASVGNVAKVPYLDEL